MIYRTFDLLTPEKKKFDEIKDSVCVHAGLSFEWQFDCAGLINLIVDASLTNQVRRRLLR